MNMCCAMRIGCEVEEELHRERKREGERGRESGRAKVYCG